MALHSHEGFRAFGAHVCTCLLPESLKVENIQFYLMNDSWRIAPEGSLVALFHRDSGDGPAPYVLRDALDFGNY